MKITLPLVLGFIGFGFASACRAEVKPNNLFTDGIVLQRGVALPVWGTAKEGEKVTVQFEGDTQEAVATGGKRLVHLKPHDAGGPFTMTIAGENSVTIKDVLVGEVWVCSGQSNMSFTLNGASNGDEERLKMDYPKIRMFNVTKTALTSPTSDTEGTWIVCASSSRPGTKTSRSRPATKP